MQILSLVKRSQARIQKCNFKLQSLVFLLILIAVSLLGIKALFLPGFYTSHDGETHIARIANFYLALKEGQIPPQLAPTLFGKLGMPIFVFIYPLPYLFASLIYSLGATFTQSFELTTAITYTLSALFMFFFLNEFFKNRLAAFVGALFFSWAPYRFSQIFVRAAFAEQFAFLFIPLCFLFLLRLAKKQSKTNISLLSLSVAGLLLSHQLVSLMFLPLLFNFGLILLGKSKNRFSFFFAALSASLLALFSSSYIYLPSLFERKYLRFDELINYFQDHFVTLKQLFHSPWGYGFSHLGIAQDSMSFQIGLTHLVVIALITLLGFAALLKNRRRFFKKYPFALFFYTVFASSALLMLDNPLTRWFWQTWPGMSILDFPWRLLGMAIFSSAFLTAYLVKRSKNNLLLVSFLIFFVFFANRNHLRINEPVFYNDDHFLSYESTATWRNEFLTRWRHTNNYGGLEPDFSTPDKNLLLQTELSKTHRLIFNVEAEQESQLIIHRLYFPDWKIYLDGQPIKFDISSATEITGKWDKSGLISLTIPPGKHRVRALFVPTRTRAVGQLLSLAGLIVAFSLLLPIKKSTWQRLSKKWLPVFMLLLLSLPAIRSLFYPAAYTSHDLNHHIVRAIHLDQALSEGQFPVRWIGDLNFGFGYPLFIFNYPLPQYLAVIFHYLGANYIWSVKLVFALSLIGSAFTFYLFSSYLFKNRLAGLVASLFYLYAPIRFVNVYVSATVGNSLAFLFIPLIFYALVKAYRRSLNSQALIAGSLGLAGLITSHNIIAFMFAPLILLFFLFFLLKSAQKLKFILKTFSFTLLGLGLSAFFWLPAVIEKRFIRYDQILKDFYQTHFVTLKQLFHSPWGYGFSHPSTALDDMCFQIGLAHLLVFTTALLLIMLLIASKKFHFKRLKSVRELLSPPRSKVFLPIAFLSIIIFIAAIFFMLEISKPIWQVVPWMFYLQMPWRLLAVTTFFSALLAGFLVILLPIKPLVSLFLITAVLIANRNHLRINQIFDPPLDFYFQQNHTTTMAHENLPRGAQKFEGTVSPGKLEIISGSGGINLITNNSHFVKANLNLTSNSQLRFNQVYFPGWQLTLDNQPLKFSYPIARPLPEFTVPAGTHQFTARFTKTPIRITADILSLSSIILLLISCLASQTGISKRPYE